MRSLAIIIRWLNQSVYYSEQLAATMYPEYKATVHTESTCKDGYFDLVMYYFGTEEHPEWFKGKIIQRWASFNDILRCTNGDVNIAGCTLLHKALLARDENAILIPFGVNPKHFSAQPFLPGPLRVGFAGPDSDVKRLHKLEEIVDSIDAELVTAIYKADGGEYHGPFRTQDMAQFYRQIHVYACSSSSEGFGRPLLEAAACGRPVVSFDVGVARDLRDTGAGVIIVNDTNDWDSFRNALIQLRDNRALITELGKKSADAVTVNWTWKVLRPRWLEVLDIAYNKSQERNAPN